MLKNEYFLFNKDGEIIQKDIFTQDNKEKSIELIRKSIMVLEEEFFVQIFKNK